MKNVLFITTDDAAPGFRLAGIDQRIAEAHELEDLLVREMNDPDHALIVLDERLISGLDEARLREIERTWPGVLVVLPSPVTGAAELEDYALKLIRRAIGYHVRLRL
jgi:V/A-type H+-transporting ATPase subunit F